jgi:cytochrome c biogenesis protein CcmG, thiol:disulfide interchange protein DsbE
MSKQWLMVLAIVAGLGLGAFALVRFGPAVEGVEVGKRAPDYRAPNLSTGDTLSLRDAAKGRVTLVNIWATWCIPCKAEMPAMEKLYRTLGPKGFRILAVSIDEGSDDDVRKFAKDVGVSFEILHDRSGRIQQIYQTTGVPESFLLDRDGVIVKKIIGEHPWGSESNQRIVTDLLGPG